MDEETIVTAVLRGDSGQYRLLIERYHVGLIIHCERLVGDRQTAEDIAQEAYIAAYQKLESFNPRKARFSTWLYRIATNKALDYLRAHKRVIPNENVDELSEEAAPDYETMERNNEVREAVQALEPPTFKQVIEAYYWQGKSYEQIATDMSIPINTVRTWLRRAKVKLRSELS